MYNQTSNPNPVHSAPRPSLEGGYLPGTIILIRIGLPLMQSIAGISAQEKSVLQELGHHICKVRRAAWEILRTGYVNLRQPRRLSAMRRLLPGCHLIAARGTADENRLYCGKLRDADPEPNAVFYERGDLPVTPAAKGDAERARYEAAWTLAKRGDMESIPSDIRVRLYPTLRKIEV